MPGPADDPKNIRLRNDMVRAPKQSFEKQSFAHQLLEAVLGGPGDRVRSLSFVDGIPERLQDIVSWYVQRYPKAGAEVLSVGPLSPEEIRNGTTGMYGGFGGVGLNPARSDEQNIATLMHEMGHGVGLGHDSDVRGPYFESPVTATQLGLASQYARSDINLPDETRKQVIKQLRAQK